MKSRFLPDWRTAVCGLFAFFCAPHVGFVPWMWIWIGLPLFLEGLRRVAGPREAMIQGFWFSFFYGVGIYFWSIGAMTEFLGAPLALSVGIWLGAAMVGQLHFVAAAGLFRWIPTKVSGASYSKHPVMAALLYASMFAALDAFAPKLFGDSLGHGFYHFPRLMQLADLGGAPVLIFVLGFWSYSAFAAYRLWVEKLPRPWVPLVSGIALLMAGLLYGEVRLTGFRAALASPTQVIKALVVQPKVSNERKRSAALGQVEIARSMVEELSRMSLDHLKRDPDIDFVFWPEAAVPTAYLLPRSLQESAIDDLIDGYVEKSGVPLVFGGDDADPETRSRFNAVLFKHPISRSLRKPFDFDVYRKGLLMPFGERIPGIDLLPMLTRFAPSLLTATIAGDEGPRAFRFRIGADREVTVNPIICYEAVRSEYVREGARLGSELILNATNDSWFAGWGEPQLHLAMSIFRSVETRLPQLRATNSGISALILPTGELRSVLDWDTSGTIRADIPIIGPSKSLATRWGDWFGPASAAVFGIVLAGIALIERRRGH